MISKTFEWYRLVSMTPGSQVIADRTKSATKLISEIETQEPGTILAMVQGIVRDFTGIDAEKPTIEWLLKTLKDQDPAISETLSENKMELRCIAAITFGELLARSNQNPSQLAEAAAAAFLSATASKPLSKKRFIANILKELSALALDTLENVAAKRRQRGQISTSTDKVNAPTDLQTAIAAIEDLRKQVNELNQNAEMDREEISLFWFIASGYSRTKKSAFASLPASVSAVHAALEVSQFVLMPPPAACYEILTALVESKRSCEDLQPIPIASHLTLWTEEENDALASPDVPNLGLAEEFPAIFPLTWLAYRTRQLAAPPGDAEVRRNTGLNTQILLTSSQLARQLLSEKVSLRLAGELSG